MNLNQYKCNAVALGKQELCLSNEDRLLQLCRRDKPVFKESDHPSTRVSAHLLVAALSGQNR